MKSPKQTENSVNKPIDTAKKRRMNRGAALYISSIAAMVIAVVFQCVAIQWIFLSVVSLLAGIVSFVLAFVTTDRFGQKTTFIKVIDVLVIFVAIIFCLIFIIGLNIGGE